MKKSSSYSKVKSVTTANCLNLCKQEVRVKGVNLKLFKKNENAKNILL